MSLLLGMVRVKFTAVYLGPLGMGLFGAYMSILGPLSTLANMGIGASGVRQIAEAAGVGDQQKIARSLLTIRRAAFVSGLLGMLLMVILAYPLSLSTFGHTDQVAPLCVLSLSLLLGSIAGGLGAILPGLRRVRQMAALGIVEAMLNLPIVIPMMMLWGVESVIPMMLASSLIQVCANGWFARRERVEPVRMSWRETWIEAKPLLRLGTVLVGTGLMGAGVAYLVRVMIIRELGLEANGLYSAAWALSSYYVSFILGAMNADFYPRLTGVNQHHAEVNRLVNEQTEVGLLMALPGIIVTLTLAPLAIMIFYTPQFTAAVEVLQWHALGLVPRLISAPICFILLAKGAKRWFFWTELLANGVHLGLTWIGIQVFGLAGTGIAFFGLYAFHVLLIFGVVRRMTGFSWAPANMRLLALTACLSVLAFLAARFLPLVWSMSLGVVLASATACYSLRALTRLIGQNPVAVAWDKLRRALPFLNRSSSS